MTQMTGSGFVVLWGFEDHVHSINSMVNQGLKIVVVTYVAGKFECM